MGRRKSVDTLVVPCRINTEERSKSIDSTYPQFYSESESIDNLELLKQTLIRQSSLNNLLMKKISSLPTTETELEVNKSILEILPQETGEISPENPTPSIIHQGENLAPKDETETVSKDEDECTLI